jgi:hypothetical protein
VNVEHEVDNGAVQASADSFQAWEATRRDSRSTREVENAEFGAQIDVVFDIKIKSPWLAPLFHHAVVCLAVPIGNWS